MAESVIVHSVQVAILRMSSVADHYRPTELSTNILELKEPGNMFWSLCFDFDTMCPLGIYIDHTLVIIVMTGCYGNSKAYQKHNFFSTIASFYHIRAKYVSLLSCKIQAVCWLRKLQYFSWKKGMIKFKTAKICSGIINPLRSRCGIFCCEHVDINPFVQKFWITFQMSTTLSPQLRPL